MKMDSTAVVTLLVTLAITGAVVAAPTYYPRFDEVDALVNEFGTAWAAASAFCTSKEQALCTFQEVCPSGEGTAPVNFALGASFADSLFVPFNGCGSLSCGCDDSSWIQVGVGANGYPNPETCVMNEDYNQECSATNPSVTQTQAYVACCPPSGTSSAGGDLHFTTWAGKRFNYQGECDLLLTYARSFQDDKGLEVHVRTKIENVYSIITAVGIQAGESTFEFNHETVGELQYYVNNVALPGLPHHSADFNITLRTVHNEHLDADVNIIIVDLGQKSKIRIDVMEQWVFVDMDVPSRDIIDSIGLTGSYTTGKWLARDGKTDLTNDRNKFGGEWQVLADEPKLFRSIPEGHPRAPDASCKLPDNETQYLRSMNSEMYDKAGDICKKEGVAPEDMDDCIFDVTVLNNPKIAAAWWGKEVSNVDQAEQAKIA